MEKKYRKKKKREYKELCGEKEGRERRVYKEGGARKDGRRDLGNNKEVARRKKGSK